MIEAELIGVETQTAKRIVAVAVFHVATDRVTHVGGMDTYLVLAARLKTIFNKRMVDGARKGVEMGHGIFASVVERRGKGDISLVVL